MFSSYADAEKHYLSCNKTLILILVVISLISILQEKQKIETFVRIISTHKESS